MKQTCTICNHGMNEHKDICDSKGKRDGKHIHCMRETKPFMKTGMFFTCGCKGVKQ